MREYKAKHLHTNVWVYGEARTTTVAMGTALDLVDSYLNTSYASMWGTLCQEVGLKDKFGKTMFEDDIVKCYGNTGVVKYIAPSFVLQEETKSGFKLHKLVGADSEHCPVEILGNIHD